MLHILLDTAGIVSLSASGGRVYKWLYSRYTFHHLSVYRVEGAEGSEQQYQCNYRKFNATVNSFRQEISSTGPYLYSVSVNCSNMESVERHKRYKYEFS